MKNNEITILPDTAHVGPAGRLVGEVRVAVVQAHAPSVRAAVLRRRPKVVRRLGEVEVGAIYVGLHEFFLSRETPTVAAVRAELYGSTGGIVSTRGIPGERRVGGRAKANGTARV